MPILPIGGARIHYVREGTGPAVLLIQGAGVGADGWRPQIEALADRFTVVALDNRGFGRSTAPGNDLSIELMARDALAIMDAERLDRFHLVGHSMGGLIAQAAALTAPQRVESLALLCTFLRGAEGARLSAGMILTALRMRIGTSRMRRNAFLELVMPAAYLRARDRVRLAESIGGLFGYDLARQPAFVMRQVRAMARYDASSRLHELAFLPTLVVGASYDRIARPEYGRALASRIPGAHVVEIPDAGHGVTIQCAGRINALLSEHFVRAAARRS